MKVAVLGTGFVGQTLASKLVSLNYEVIMGTRKSTETMARITPSQMVGTSFAEWYSKNKAVQLMNFSELPLDMDIFINATSGKASIDVLTRVGNKVLADKIILDVANPLDFSTGMPPTLFISNNDSLAESIQRTFPSVRVVKALNTVNAAIMINPGQIHGIHHIFICGNDAGAKQKITQLLQAFGWGDNQIIDLGDITAARATEQLHPLWIRLMSKFGSPHFNFSIVKS
ncbi:MAG: NADPH-dependent F420 reductase [Bacteroidota bacterium]